MKVGTHVDFCTHGSTIGSSVVRETGHIVAVGTSNDINTQACYDVMIDGQIAKFYIKPQLRTGFHLNVGNAAFWIQAHFLN